MEVIMSLTSLFNDKKFLKTLFKLALPIALQNDKD